MKRKKLKGGGGRRPARQRTQVQHYTDDIPGTFTKKKKRGSDDDDGDSESSESEDDSNSQQQQQQQQQQGVSGSNFHALENPNNDAVVAKASKHKRKRPAKSPVTATATNNSNNAGSTSTTQNNTRAATTTTTKLQEMPPPPPPQNVMLSHMGSLAPILPVATTCPLAQHSLAQQYPVVYGRGLGAALPPPPPAWSPVHMYDFYFPEDYKRVPVASPANNNNMDMEEDMDGFSNSNNTPKLAPMVKPGPWPVCRVVTSVCSFGRYMAIGDSAGFVLLYISGPRGVRAITRLDTSASRREHQRQRDLQSKVEQQCRHKPELLEKRSAFWATAKTPNAIESMTWLGDMIIIMTPLEVECLKLVHATATACPPPPSQSLGGNQNCEILWTIVHAPVGGPRKQNGSNALLTGGELVGSFLELHHSRRRQQQQQQGNYNNTMALWNTWGVAPRLVVGNNVAAAAAAPKTNQKEMDIDNDNGYNNNKEEQENSNSDDDDDDEPPEITYDWPLLLMRDANATAVKPTDFVKIIPFQREQEEEAPPPPVPVKRSPGRPPKKKPKPMIPVTERELLWTDASRCHAALWDNCPFTKDDRLIVVYSTTATVPASDAQVHLALLVLTDDSDEHDSAVETFSNASAMTTTPKSQYAKLKKQIAVPVTGSARNVANVPEVTLRQSPKGTYTLVAGSRGVRMYQTETMTLLRVYGENVSLHGKGMVWKSCFVLDNRLQQQLYRQQQDQWEPKNTDQGEDGDDSDDDLGKTLLRQNRQGFVWIEQDNPLASLLEDSTNSSAAAEAGVTTRRGSPQQKLRASSSFEYENNDEDDESTWLHQAWIVGIPHPFRGPKELQETLYFWQGEEKLPLFTLPLPHQSGGVQSIHPLVPQSNRNNSMWLRMMVSTVHGECFELAPSLKSDFPGNMYNPGYSVIQDNIEYIEDEEELDKVMVEVPEVEEEESDEEEEVIVEPDISARVGGDFVDPELAEAIRLSLLESKDKSKVENEHTEKHAADGDDQDDSDSEIVIVKDVFDDDEGEMVIPCEPEPFLRQKVLLDLESESMVDGDEASARDKSAKDAEFASEVLPILPQSRFAQRRWEKQKVRIEKHDGSLLRKSQFLLQQPQQPASAVDSSLGQPATKLGRGKRTKAGNLGALLEASMDPELRQYMMDRDRLWVDGSGATLQDDAWDDAVVVAPSTGDASAKESSGDEQRSTQAFESTTAAANVGAAPAGTSEPAPGKALESEHTDTNMKPAEVAAAASSVPESVENVEGIRISQKPDESEEKKASKSSGLTTQKVPPELNFTATNENGNKNKTVINGEQLAPPSGIHHSNDASGVQMNGMQIAIIELKDYSDTAQHSDMEQQYSCTGTIEIPLTLEDRKIPNDESAASGEDQTMQLATGVEALLGDKVMNGVGTPINRKDGAGSATKAIVPCAACQGRMVIHSCGKRALPIDFEALARAEKDREDREEEEKRRLKIEKRKQAEAKRREAKKKKKETERLEKLEKEEELRRIREVEIVEARSRMADIGDFLGTGSPEPHDGKDSTAPGPSLAGPASAAPGGTDKVHYDGATSVHFDIADAWKEHAQKFSSNEATGGQTNDSSAASSDALAALATMAEAATPQTGVHSHVSRVEHQQKAVEASRAAVGSANETPSIQEHTNAVAEQKRVVHGFFSLEDAYPQHSQSTALETRAPFAAASAARIARANQVLNSYHDAISATGETVAPGAAGTTPTKAQDVDLSSQGHLGQEARAHSFQISPVSHSPANQTTVNYSQQNYVLPGNHTPSAASQEASAAGNSSRPYFGYTQLSSSQNPNDIPGSDAASNQPHPTQHQGVARSVIAAASQPSAAAYASQQHPDYFSAALGQQPTFPTTGAPAAAARTSHLVYPSQPPQPPVPWPAQSPAHAAVASAQAPPSNQANGTAQLHAAQQPQPQTSAVHKNP